MTKNWRNEYPEKQPMIVITDEASGTPVPHSYSCLGSEFYRTTEYEGHFITIEPRETYVVSGEISSYGLEPSHTYSVYIRDARLYWWAYGRKSEVLEPGDKECARIFRKTGKRHVEKFSTVLEARDGVIKTVLGEPVVFSILEEDSTDEKGG
jgi:hypothetical protein